MCKKGKFDLFQKLLPCKKGKSDDIPPPPPPPYGNPPSYSHASMFGYPGLGVVANHLPAASASGSKETVDGFNVWSINGYSGFVPFSKLDNPTETIGRLEIMKQIQHGRHDYDPSKLDAPPRPPTPSAADKKIDAEIKKREFKTLSVEPPSYDPPRYEEVKDECKICRGESGQPVRKIKRLRDQPMCWECVFRNFQAEAYLAWQGK